MGVGARMKTANRWGNSWAHPPQLEWRKRQRLGSPPPPPAARVRGRRPPHYYQREVSPRRHPRLPRRAPRPAGCLHRPAALEGRSALPLHQRRLRIAHGPGLHPSRRRGPPRHRLRRPVPRGHPRLPHRNAQRNRPRTHLPRLVSITSGISTAESRPPDDRRRPLRASHLH